MLNFMSESVDEALRDLKREFDDSIAAVGFAVWGLGMVHAAIPGKQVFSDRDPSVVLGCRVC